MHRCDVEAFFGTLERGNPKLLEAVMPDKEAARFIKRRWDAVGGQRCVTSNP
jgi:hypothetical protein